jgi:hypothetical protein
MNDKCQTQLGQGYVYHGTYSCSFFSKEVEAKIEADVDVAARAGARVK